ncbi:hypothetical protein ACFT5B_02785 [Luteimicrobium sp. NPDC057192]|uniref:hypothetical protein n=1 Tax=Luteimicrobium sp. NPDC057192 TaxID=3346042 RepID=UPI00363A64D4
MRKGRSGAVAATLGAVVLASLSACSSSPTPSSPPRTPVPTASLTVPGATPSPTSTLAGGAHWPGLPPSFGEPSGFHAAGVGWTADDALLYVVVAGSSSCPPVASSPATRTSDGIAVVVEKDRYAGQACTADMAPTTTVVALPDGVAPGAAVSVVIDGRGPVTLPAAADGDGPVWVDAE